LIGPVAIALALLLGLAQVVAAAPRPQSPARRLYARKQVAVDRLFAQEPPFRFTPHALRRRIGSLAPGLANRLWPRTPAQGKLERLRDHLAKMEDDSERECPPSLVLRDLGNDHLLVFTETGQFGVAHRLGTAWVVRRPHAGSFDSEFDPAPVEAELDRALAVFARARKHTLAELSALRFIRGTLVLW
jgi:hypothetical protein